jgi:anti-sigma-K factor RskA
MVGSVEPRPIVWDNIKAAIGHSSGQQAPLVLPETPPPSQHAPSPVPSAQYVALLQRDGGSPAFILTVDAATKNFTVRKVGADPEPGKSFELWLISDRLPQPRSLGVIGGSDFTARPVLADFDASTINTATYAVTVEQAGGSPSGQPTSAPIYTGKLIETVPAGAPPR